MEVLGLNGTYPRSHDSSACLIIGNTLAASVEEERFIRRKKALDTLPQHSIAYCLEQNGLNPNELDAITHGWLGPAQKVSDVMPEPFAERTDPNLEIIRIPHHEAHAASVFYTSPFDESAVIIVDGQGADESTTIWHATDQGLKKLESYNVDMSLGYTYASISRFCGLGTFGAGKVMGLAPYGEPRYVDAIATAYDATNFQPDSSKDSQDQFFGIFLSKLREQGFHTAEFAYIYDPLSCKSRKEPVILQEHKDMAASAQAFLEQRVLALAERTKLLTGSDNLCLAGGVAMNCVANSLIQNSGLFTQLFMQPGCEDSGIALGSALAYSKEKVILGSPYTGPAFSDAAIKKILEANCINFKAPPNVAEAAAELIVAGHIVGWFQGGLEYGPRALGGRSILANPDSIAMRDRVNTAKSREQWRPFGPSILSEAAPDLLENAQPSPYMPRSFTVRETWRRKLAAIVHIDGSTRPQTVEADTNPHFYDLIKYCGELTGTPAVLNTSFNGAEEPIVMTPTDALRTFASSGLDSLVLGSFIVSKH